MTALLFSLDPSLVLVLFLASPAPFRCDINAIFLFLVALLFGLMYSSRFVLSRTVHCVENQRRRSRVQELMFRASWHNDHVSRLDVLLFTGNLSKPCSRRKGKDLIHSVNLETVSAVFHFDRISGRHTSSPMSPPTGTVMSTNCE